jgi:hypothetical protein
MEKKTNLPECCGLQATVRQVAGPFDELPLKNFGEKLVHDHGPKPKVRPILILKASLPATRLTLRR